LFNNLEKALLQKTLLHQHFGLLIFIFASYQNSILASWQAGRRTGKEHVHWQLIVVRREENKEQGMMRDE
jgi:hypothetical protein